MLAQALTLILLVSSSFSQQIDYTQNGANWGGPCTITGTSKQSPINIAPSTTVYDSKLELAALFKDGMTVTVTDPYDAVQSSVTGVPISRLKATNNQGTTYNYVPVNFHFHAPSEHTIEGVLYDLELHFVHSYDTTGPVPPRPFAVVGILFKVDDTKPPHPFIDALKLQVLNVNNPQSLTLNFKTDLFDKFSLPLTFYNYDGSLTTPGCSEVVNWYVMGQVQTITTAQFNEFNRRYAGNPAFAGGKGSNRVTVALNGRTVKRGMTWNGNPVPEPPADTLSGWAIACIVLIVLNGIMLIVFFAKLIRLRMSKGEKAKPPTSS